MKRILNKKSILSITIVLLVLFIILIIILFNKGINKQEKKTNNYIDSSIYLGEIYSSDSKIKIDRTRLDYKSSTDTTKFYLTVTPYNDYENLALKIIFDINNDDLVYPIVIRNAQNGTVYKNYYTYDGNLVLASNWKVEVTTIDDLKENYGYNAN